MKARLLTGKYYRREDGKLVKYSAGDILEVSSAEARRLDVREEIIIPTPVKKTMTRTKKEPVVAVNKKNDPQKEDSELENVDGD